MGKIYVPNVSNNNCVVIRDTNTIRVYEQQPTYNSTISYKDYYIHSDYMYSSGSTTFSNYTTLPTCMQWSNLTTDIWYRVDFPSIMVCSLAILFFGYFLIRNLIRTLFVDWRYS